MLFLRYASFLNVYVASLPRVGLIFTSFQVWNRGGQCGAPELTLNLVITSVSACAGKSRSLRQVSYSCLEGHHV